jgi:TorA maturation chaperone TorD
MAMLLDLAREGLYRFLAAALRDPREPAAALARDPDCQRQASAAADLLRAEAADRAMRRGLGELPIDMLTLGPAVEMLQDGLEELGVEYNRVFGLVPSAQCPPYETEYHAASEPFFRSQQLADVAGFYQAFGLVPAQACPERPDYLPLQLEFMAFLLLKKRLANEVNDLDLVDICAKAEVDFFRDHLAWWVPAFTTGLRRRAGSGVYAALAQALAAFLPTERQRLGVDTPTIPVVPTRIERPEEQAACSGCPATL